MKSNKYGKECNVSFDRELLIDALLHHTDSASHRDNVLHYLRETVFDLSNTEFVVYIAGGVMTQEEAFKIVAMIPSAVDAFANENNPPVGVDATKTALQKTVSRKLKELECALNHVQIETRTVADQFNGDVLNVTPLRGQSSFAERYPWSVSVKENSIGLRRPMTSFMPTGKNNAVTTGQCGILHISDVLRYLDDMNMIMTYASDVNNLCYILRCMAAGDIVPGRTISKIFEQLCAVLKFTANSTKTVEGTAAQLELIRTITELEPTK